MPIVLMSPSMFSEIVYTIVCTVPLHTLSQTQPLDDVPFLSFKTSLISTLANDYALLPYIKPFDASYLRL